MPTTRYPGVASFPDTKLAHQLFFGREEDSKKLFYFIASEILTVLYSKSGYGKTSLLQAGVFKILRDENYYPVSVRLNKKDRSPQELIELEILNINNQKDYEAIIKPGAKELTTLFEELEIWSPGNKLLIPIIILDQFEEIFTLEHNFQYQTSFINELAEVLNKAKEGHLRAKFVLSIREDFLGHLEKLAVKIPSIFSNRFRLEALSKNAAKEAITKPAQLEIADTVFDSLPIRFSQDALDELLRFLSLKITEGGWSETNEVEPVQLQIICSELEERALRQKNKNEDVVHEITRNDLGGEAGLRNILGNFYDKQIKKVCDESKLTGEEILALRNVIERELIVGKRRVPMAYDAITAKNNVRKEAIDSLINTKLLKKESYQQNFLVEISHDALVEPILKSFEVREFEERQYEIEKKWNEAEQTLLENRKRLRLKNYAIYFLISSLVGGTIWIVFSVSRVETMKKEAEELVRKKGNELDSTIKKKQAEIDSINNIKDGIINYIKSVGNKDSSSKTEKAETMQADLVLNKLLADPNNKPDANLKIQYFKNNLDNITVWIVLKEIGYKNFAEIDSKINPAEGIPNGLFYDYRIKLTDLKIVALTLIKAGFKLRRIAEIDRPSTIQIITRRYQAHETLPTALTVDEVLNAKSAGELDRGGKF